MLCGCMVLMVGLLLGSPLVSAQQLLSDREQQQALDDLERKHFDSYTLALTWHPGFCATRRQPPRECRDPVLMAAADDGFVIHGLWPSRPDRLIDEGLDIDTWHREGCFVEHRRPRGGFCEMGPPIEFDTELENALNASMPGRASCLDRYEYAKHGACTGVNEEDFFEGAIALAEIVNASALGDFMLAHRGEEVSRNALITAFEDAFGDGTGSALSLQCGGPSDRFLTEIRIGIDAERVDDFPSASSLVDQPHGRCPRYIEIRSFR
ncbi:ribonuclease T2 family protein [Halomonas huangheensis]|nr:ribonuclease I [Halomonas huangheensis]